MSDFTVPEEAYEDGHVAGSARGWLDPYKMSARDDHIKAIVDAAAPHIYKAAENEGYWKGYAYAFEAVRKLAGSAELPHSLSQLLECREASHE